MFSETVEKRGNFFVRLSLFHICVAGWSMIITVRLGEARIGVYDEMAMKREKGNKKWLGHISYHSMFFVCNYYTEKSFKVYGDVVIFSSQKRCACSTM